MTTRERMRIEHLAHMDIWRFMQGVGEKEVAHRFATTEQASYFFKVYKLEIEYLERTGFIT